MRTTRRPGSSTAQLASLNENCTLAASVLFRSDSQQMAIYSDPTIVGATKPDQRPPDPSGKIPKFSSRFTIEEVETGREVAQGTFAGILSSVAFDPQGQLLVGGLRNDKQRFRGLEHQLRSVRLENAGKIWRRCGVF